MEVQVMNMTWTPGEKVKCVIFVILFQKC